ncbi:MAG: hypothetical protein ACREAK_12140 [Nitrosarchaeum sp.]
MSKEMLGKSINAENVTKEKLIEVIKTSKNDSRTPEQETTDLVSSFIENHVSDMIEKMESTIPTYVKYSSDLYKKYLHIINNFYNSTYWNQKEILDKMGVNDDVLTMFDAYLKSIKQISLLQMDVNENMVKKYVEYRLSVLDVYDQMINGNIASFTKMFEKFNSFKNIE